MEKPRNHGIFRAGVASVALLTLGTSATACASQDNNTSKPTPTTVINGKSTEVRKDGSVKIKGITYFPDGTAQKETYPVARPDGYEYNSTTEYACVGNRLQAMLWTPGYRPVGISIVPHDPACVDGTIEPGELTKLSTSETTN